MRIKNIIFTTIILCIIVGGLFYSLVDTSSTPTKPIIKETTATPEAAASTENKPAKTESEDTDVNSNLIDKTIKTIQAQTSNLSPDVLKTSLTAYFKAEKLGLNQKQILTIVDYSLPSTERRLWVIDMKNSKVLFNTWVAHGTNSGGAKPTSFSNKPSSLKSSLGVFITDAPYTGGKGYSLRIKGLEHNINDNAYNRTIVFHGAWYVSSSFAKARGMMGRSWGCFAVDNKIVKSLINTIKEKTLVVAYYPDKNWLRHSSFIN